MRPHAKAADPVKFTVIVRARANFLVFGSPGTINPFSGCGFKDGSEPASVKAQKALKGPVVSPFNLRREKATGQFLVFKVVVQAKAAIAFPRTSRPRADARFHVLLCPLTRNLRHECFPSLQVLGLQDIEFKAEAFFRHDYCEVIFSLAQLPKVRLG